MKTMVIGVDFDNTIVCYDELFHRVAIERGLIPEDLEPVKEQVRDYLRCMDREDEWTVMQGYVYGVRIHEAAPYPGVKEFFSECRRSGVDLCIVSHKTRYPYAGPAYDLHKAACDWLETKGFTGSENHGLPSDRVFFELTKQEKLERISTAGCTHFIDDLPEFLLEPSFPTEVKRILFDPAGKSANRQPFPVATSWRHLLEMLRIRREITR